MSATASASAFPCFETPMTATPGAASVDAKTNFPQESELVNSELTNSPPTSVLISELIVKYFTNYSNIDMDIDRELVNQLLTISHNPIGGRAIHYIFEYQVFLVPPLYRNAKIKKQHAYEIVNELIRLGIVKKTQYKVSPPLRSMKGPKPRIYTLAHIELEGGMDSRIEEARSRYFETFERYDPDYRAELVKQDLTNTISQTAVDYFRGKGRYGKHQGPSRHQVVEYLKREYPDLEPIIRGDLSQKIVNKLYFEKFKN